MALDTTVGGATANSWASLAEYKVYAVNRLPQVLAAVSVDNGGTATDAQIEVALIVACRFVNQDFAWTGSAADSVQALTWPRIGMSTRNGFPIPSTVNPIELKNAQCEVAYTLLAGVDLVSDNDAVKGKLSSVKAGSVAVSFQSLNLSTVEGLDNAVRILNSEFAYVSDQVSGEVRRILVPSWFAQPSIIRPIIFSSFGQSRR